MSIGAPVGCLRVASEVSFNASNVAVKAIKQNLKIKAFVGTSRNAVLIQLWIAMITYLLVAIAGHSVRKGWTVQRMLRVIQLKLFECKTLKEILDPDPPRHKKSEPQLRLAL